VEARSEGQSQGATFIVKLPIRAVHAPPAERDADEPSDDKKPAQVAAPDLAPAPSVWLDGLRILVVDDEPDARRLVAKALDAVGASVTLAESGAEALEMLPKVNPHVLVSDLGMPEMDGYDLIWAIRSAGHSAKELPAVALTAFAHKEHQRRALLAGFQVHVAKPVDPHDLLVVVASVAGRTGAG
jgi:CheY-like chemotaxis protein